MRKLFVVLLCMFIGMISYAQKNGSVKGVVYDTLAREAVASATVSVMDKKDSSLVSFTLTDNTGHFELKGIPNGEYRLLVTHVNYHGSNTFFKIDDNDKNKDLGSIVANDKNKVLEEVIVSNEAPPVTLVGDTIQYNAGSFKVAPNASVEQLLKKLPGIKVDKNGTITAQGEKATKVLVDGKEFFGNDPKIATRNLPADAIDKVQVYDKQSDQAQLTGFEDGNYEKTINLKLKKDKKKGVFGKVKAGGGDDGRYEGKFNVNSFKGARQMSAIGMGNNTNGEGFSFMDVLSFTGALSQMKQSGGGGNVNINLSESDAMALGMNSQNNGIVTAWGGGVNYNNIIGKNLDLQSNYFFNRYNPNIQTRIYRQNFLPGSTNYYNSQGYTDNLNNSHRLNLNMLFQLDSSSTLRVNPSLSLQNTKNRYNSSYNTRNVNGDLINQGVGSTSTNSSGYNFKNDLMYRKKFKRKGRTLSLSLTNSMNESDADGNVNSIVNYFSAGNVYRRDTINQQNTTKGELNGYSARIVYTEPLWRKSLLELSTGTSNTLNKADKRTYDYNKGNGKYDKANDILSNDFENRYSYTNAGVRVRKQGRKYSYSVGLTWQRAELEGKIISGVKDSVINKDFRTFLPNATFKYNLSKFKSFAISYGTNTNQPTLSQLQPVPDNSNPLYIRLGNPGLKQEFAQSLRANLNMISPYKSTNMFLNLSGTTTRNKIVSYDTVDLITGIRTMRPINVNGVYNINANLSYGRPMKFLKGSVQLGSSLMYNSGKQFINGSENKIKTLGLGPTLNVDANPTEWLSLSTGVEYRINSAKYSLVPAQNTNYLSQEYNVSADLQLPKSFFFSTDFSYTINNQLAAGFNRNIAIWNASISKQFMKYKRGELKLAVSDLLNNNSGVSRNTNQNYIEDREVNTLKRFFLMSFTYSLSKTGLNQGKMGGMNVQMR
jgi:hypothetical protein